MLSLLLRRLKIENFWIATPLSEARNDEIKNTNFRYFIDEVIKWHIYTKQTGLSRHYNLLMQVV